ncbi:MAG TPA: endo-1,4-beta-xylanase [Steroidobacteraceae bacterium]
MSRWTRRECLQGASAAAVAAWAGADAQSETDQSLDALARRSGRRFGTALSTRGLRDGKYLKQVRRECGLLVAENEHKWYVVRSKPQGFNFEPADRLIAFAKENQLGFRGHTLLWHHRRWLPKWLESHDFGANPAAEAERMIVEFIDKSVARHGDIIQSWDVVNETVDENTGELRDTVLSKHLGRQEVVEIAFHAARHAAPRAQLVYNDYMSWDAGSAEHRAGVLRLLENLRKRNVPLDALGVQSHIGAANTEGSKISGRIQEREWRSFLDEVTGMGLALLITEFDVHDRDLTGSIEERDREVAAQGRAYLELMLSYPQLQTVMVWGLADHHSWLQERTPRPDGLPKRPTPYDSQCQPKPLREAIAAALRSALRRPQST